MKNFKHLIALAFLVALGMGSAYFVNNNNEENSPIYITIIVIISALFLFNLSVRQVPFFKAYFTSPLNFLSSKYRTETVYDLSPELLYGQLKEVLEKSTFELFHWNDEKLELMAKSSFCWKSWGENIYIQISQNENGETILDFSSVAIMQLYTWGKNENNFKKLTNHIEESLTI